MNYINIRQLNEDILNNIYKIPKDIDLIVGIPRSGMIVASLISVYMNKPLTDIESFLERKFYESGSTKNTTDCVKEFSEVKKVIVVDDSIASGKSIEKVKKEIEKSELDIKVIYLVPYVVQESRNKCDIFFKVVDLPRRFEWNLFHHIDLEKACVDIDGVLCQDPMKKENDDGKKYEHFIKNAKIKYIPSRKIGYVVTSRLEKYRKLTEEWLKNNNIQYGKLIMMDVPTAEERRRLGNHGKFKGRIYKKLKDSTLFIESEIDQAKEIRNISGKNVICVDNNGINCIDNSFKNKLVNRIKRILKRCLSEKKINKLKRIMGK